MATFVIGAFPAFAAYILHWCFKKMKIPSPLSVKGAMSWGASAGGLGHRIVSGGVGVVPSVEVLPGACSPRALKKIRASATGAVKDRLAESRQYKPRRPTIDPSREYSTSRHAVGWDSPLFTKSAHARAVVRAAQMYGWSRYLGQEAIAKTREIEINVEPGEHWTVDRVINEYRLAKVTIRINKRLNSIDIDRWQRMAENDRAYDGENWGEKFRINRKGEPDAFFEKVFKTYCARHRYGVL